MQDTKPKTTMPDREVALRQFCINVSLPVAASVDQDPILLAEDVYRFMTAEDPTNPYGDEEEELAMFDGTNVVFFPLDKSKPQ